MLLFRVGVVMKAPKYQNHPILALMAGVSLLPDSQTYPSISTRNPQSLMQRGSLAPIEPRHGISIKLFVEVY